MMLPTALIAPRIRNANVLAYQINILLVASRRKMDTAAITNRILLIIIQSLLNLTVVFTRRALILRESP